MAARSARWLRDIFSAIDFGSREDILLSEHQKSSSGFTRQFLVFDLIVRKVENPCSHSHVVGNARSLKIAFFASVG